MPTAEVRQLSDLLEVSQTLGSTLNLKGSLTRILEILEESRGTISAAYIVSRGGEVNTAPDGRRSVTPARSSWSVEAFVRSSSPQPRFIASSNSD